MKKESCRYNVKRINIISTDEGAREWGEREWEGERVGGERE